MSKKKLFKIGHLAKTLGLTHRTIRYYDQLGLLPHMKRSNGGVRLFDDEDIKILKKIRTLQKEEYLPLDIIKKSYSIKNHPLKLHSFQTMVPFLERKPRRHTLSLALLLQKTQSKSTQKE